MSQAQQEESQLPEMIKLFEQERNVQARKALQMKKKLKLVEGSADDDVKEIKGAQPDPSACHIDDLGAVEHVNSSSATYLLFFSNTPNISV